VSLPPLSLEWVELGNHDSSARAVVDGTEILLHAGFYRYHITVWRERVCLVAATRPGRVMRPNQERAIELLGREWSVLEDSGVLTEPVSVRWLGELRRMASLLDLMGTGFFQSRHDSRAWFAAKALREAAISALHPAKVVLDGVPTSRPWTGPFVDLTVELPGAGTLTRTVDFGRHPRADLARAAAMMVSELEAKKTADG
jgi:hypothetical protein